MAVKNHHQLKLALFCISMLLTISLYSQTNENQAIEKDQNIHLIGKYSGGQVILRWAPASRELWEQGNRTGYHIERLALPANSGDLENRQFERLTVQPILPASASEWEATTLSDDAAAAAYMVLFSDLPQLIASDPFTNMKQQSELQDNAFFIAMSSAELSAKAADLLGLRYTDKKAEKDGRYIYRVIPAAPFIHGQSDTAGIYISTEEEEATPVPLALETSSGEQVVFVRWNISLNKSNFFAYHIERSDSPNGPFIRLNQRPLIFMKNREIEGEGDDIYTFTDSIGTNYRKCYYRITGITPYGEKSRPSEVVMGMGKDLTPPLAPSIKKAERKEGKISCIQWEKTMKEPDFKGFIVGRSEHPEGPFEPLHEGFLPPATSEFFDKNPKVEGRNFYAVSALDTAGNSSISLSAYVLFPDLTPPAAPVGLKGTVDSNGVVQLTWIPNREEDLMGYRVYWSNDREHKFIMVSSDAIREAAYTDTIQLKTLTEHVYYRIVSVDNGFGHSDFSEIIELKRPDVVPPSAGVFTQILSGEEGIQLVWVPSGSNDLASQQLLRRQPGADWILVKSFGKTTNSYLDKPESRGIYEYVLRSVDDDGLLSETSFPASVNFMGKGELPPVEELQAVYHEGKKALELRWRYPASADRFVIYRSENGESMASYASVAGNNTFTDFRIKENGAYTYAVRAVNDAAGMESALRETGAIRMK